MTNSPLRQKPLQNVAGVVGSDSPYIKYCLRRSYQAGDILLVHAINVVALHAVDFGFDEAVH
ncbi:MAG: hypothetical protein ACKO10_08925, partial [Betaproteobacteria bacterium]